MDKSKWEYKKLGEVALYPRKRFEKEFLNVGNYVGVENLIKDKKGRIDAEDIPANSSSTIEYYKNDILIGNIRPYLRKIWIADNNGGASGDVLVIRINVDYQKKIFPNYLYRVLSNDSFFDYDMAHSKGAKMPRGDKDAVLKYIIPVPSYADQQRIVAELDCLNKMIAVKQEQLKEFDKLAQSIFYDMFGEKRAIHNNWPKCCIGDIYKFQYGKGNNIPEDKGDYPCYGSNGVVGHHVVYNSEDAPVIGHIGAYAGIVNWGKGKHYVTYNGVICKLKDNKNNPIYGFYLLKSQDYLNAAKRGVAQPFVSYDLLEKPVTYLPPLSLQQQFADKISAIEAQKELVKQSIAETQHLLDYTMDKYFG